MRTREEIYNSLNFPMNMSFSTKDTNIVGQVDNKNNQLLYITIIELLLDTRDQNEEIKKLLDNIWRK